MTQLNPASVMRRARDIISDPTAFHSDCDEAIDRHFEEVRVVSPDALAFSCKGAIYKATIREAKVKFLSPFSDERAYANNLLCLVNMIARELARQNNIDANNISEFADKISHARVLGIFDTIVKLFEDC